MVRFAMTPLWYQNGTAGSRTTLTSSASREITDWRLIPSQFLLFYWAQHGRSWSILLRRHGKDACGLRDFDRASVCPILHWAFALDNGRLHDWARLPLKFQSRLL